MVLGTPSRMASQLTFGIDRILAQDENATSDLDRGTSQEAPCAGCISSLYRCCGRPQICNPGPRFYSRDGPGIHTPQPIRPYTNAVLHAEGQSSRTTQSPPIGGTSKRKRSWSRAVFSNLQRKGLEKRFQLQKYITKPDRRQLAATLGLTDAQVKVWFQNRRMKWRHAKDSFRPSTAREEDAQDEVQKDPDVTCEDSDVDVQTVDTM